MLQEADIYLEEVEADDPSLQYNTANEFSSYGRHSLPATSNTIFRIDKENSVNPNNGKYEALSYKHGNSTTSSSNQQNYGIVHRTAYQQSLSVPRRASKKKSAFGMKKPCNCTKSMCLKLYCDCFANGEFCRDCNCKDCHNNMEYEAERSRAIKQSLERNPQAFQPKIGVAPKGQLEAERLHQKGCHCKKSSCLKNYCECYEAKVACTDRCKCTSCRNTESDRIAKAQLASARESSRVTSASLLSVASGSCLSTSASASRFSDEESDSEERSDPKTRPWFYLRDEVIEATTTCLVAQADELENSGGTEEILESGILHEFANAIRKIIEHSQMAGLEIEQQDLYQ